MLNSSFFWIRAYVFIPILLLSLSVSCSEGADKKLPSGTPGKVLKAKYAKSKCCSNKPSRFPSGPKTEKLLIMADLR